MFNHCPVRDARTGDRRRPAVGVGTWFVLLTSIETLNVSGPCDSFTYKLLWYPKNEYEPLTRFSTYDGAHNNRYNETNRVASWCSQWYFKNPAWRFCLYNTRRQCGVAVRTFSVLYVKENYLSIQCIKLFVRVCVAGPTCAVVWVPYSPNSTVCMAHPRWLNARKTLQCW